MNDEALLALVVFNDSDAYFVPGTERWRMFRLPPARLTIIVDRMNGGLFRCRTHYTVQATRCLGPIQNNMLLGDRQLVSMLRQTVVNSIADMNEHDTDWEVVTQRQAIVNALKEVANTHEANKSLSKWCGELFM